MLSLLIVLEVLGFSAAFAVLHSLCSASNFCTASKRDFLAALSAELPVVVVDGVAIGTVLGSAAVEVAVIISEARTGTTGVVAAALVVASSSFVSNNDEIIVAEVT